MPPASCESTTSLSCHKAEDSSRNTRHQRKRRRIMCGRNNRKLLVVNDVVTVATSMFIVLSSIVTPPPILSVRAFAAPPTTSSGRSFGGPSGGSSISKKSQLRYAQEMEFDFTTAETCTKTGGPTARKASGVTINTYSHFSSTHDGLEKLRNCMVTSHHRSDDETYEVLSAIYAAADGDEQLLSDVVELLTVLVQECEVGTDALVAAAFHYCSITSTSRTLESLSLLPTDSLVSSVVENAEHLSRTEAIASSIYAGVANCNREARHQSAEYLRSLLLAETSNWRALVIRCAVHLFQLKKILNANQQYEATTTTTSANNIKNNRAANIRLLAKEAMDIYAPLASRLGMHRLKNEIEDTAFQILYRRQYEKVMSLYRRGEMEPILRTIKSKVEHVLEMNSSLQEYTSSMVVTSRVKEPFSLWKKMIRSNNRNNVHAVPDAIALRIILDAKPQITSASAPPENIEITRARERALCYYVQRVIIEECLPPASGMHHTRRKDYIARPKNNGYQSLHYTAAAEPYLLEVQVRSGEMHRVAEYGIAAHWDYKLNSRRSSSSTTRSSISNDANRKETFSRKIPVYGKTTNDSYLKSVQAWQLAQEEKRKKSCSEENKADVVLSEFLSASEKRAEDRVKPYLDALTTTKFDLEREQVLVFVSPTSTIDDVTTKTAEELIPSHVNYAASGGNGQVLSLPYGSCVLDALRAVGKPSGRRSPANCWHNGSLITSETQRLRNGDVLSMAMTP